MSPTSYQAAPLRDIEFGLSLLPFSQNWCRKPGSNRYGMLVPRDFKSRASANFATPAQFLRDALSFECLNIIAYFLRFVKSFCCFFQILLFFGPSEHFLYYIIFNLLRNIPNIKKEFAQRKIRHQIILLVRIRFLLRHSVKHFKAYGILGLFTVFMLYEFFNHVTSHSDNLKTCTTCHVWS